MIDIAHPSTGGLESDHRQIKMNNVLRLISELQKFLEDDQFKLSEKLEPNSPLASSASSKESVRSSKPPAGHHPNPDILSGLNLSPAKRAAGIKAGSGKPFVPGHRKSKSEGG